MRLVISHDRCCLFWGDSASILDVLPESSVDAIVTDPPAGIEFMGKEWDSDKGGRDGWIKWLADILRAALRALKPGGHALVWAIPRTSHWTAMALELAGFEVRDVHHHIFGTGFPKSLTSKSAPIPEDTGTALKPAVEHWILARRPLDGTVGANFAEHGTGVLQIGACRVEYDESGPPGPVYSGAKGEGVGQVYGASGKYQSNVSDDGRWPAHLSLEHGDACAPGACVLGCPVRLLDEQSGVRRSGEFPARRTGIGFKECAYGTENTGTEGTRRRGSAGTASRFFYVAKAPRKEKDLGLDHLAPKLGGEATGRAEGSAGTKNPRAGAGRTGGARNFHPTVKSVDLMRWLVRLVTPPGGVVLDLFAGSGTTGVAALAEGLSFVGVEQGGKDGEYVPIVEGRLRAALLEYAPELEASDRQNPAA